MVVQLNTVLAFDPSSSVIKRLLRIMSSYCKPKSDVGEWSVRSQSTLFTTHLAVILDTYRGTKLD